MSPPTAVPTPPTEINSDGDRIPSQWVPYEMAMPAFAWLHISQVPADADIRILTWKIAIESDSTISSAILWIRYSKAREPSARHVLAHVRRFEGPNASWRLLDVVSDFMQILYVSEFDHAPQQRELDYFIEHTCWDVKSRMSDPSRAKLETLIAADVCEHAWRACTGKAPNRSYQRQ